MQDINSYCEEIRKLKEQGRLQDLQLDEIEKKIQNTRGTLEKIRKDFNRAVFLTFASVCLIFISVLLPKLCFARNVIIGDSHVGGLAPFLKNHMTVRYKNGTTARYWKTQPVIHADTLFVMTGTNEQFVGISPSQWVKDTKYICNKWNPRRCFIIAPPPNKKRNYKTYWNAVSDQKNVIYVNATEFRDGVHLTQRQYRKIADKIKGIK